MWRYKVSWTGGRIGSGVSVFHVGGATAVPDWTAANTAFRAWFNSIGTNMPNDVLFTFPSEVEKIDPATGALVEVVGIAAAASVQGSDASTQWSAPAGRLVKWTTGVVVGGKRQIGHTFIVPTAAGAFTEGSVSSGVRTTDATAHAALILALDNAQADLRVWSRKQGVSTHVTSGATLQRPTVLRSRND